MKRPPDIARVELRVSDDTRVWKGDSQIRLADLAVGDVLLFNLTADLPGKPALATDLWVGEDTHKLVAETQTKKLGINSKTAKKK